MSLARLRRLFLDVHLWMGVGLGLALIPLGLSGSASVFHDELLDLFSAPPAGLTDGKALPPAAYVEAVRASLGANFIVWEIDYPARAGEPVSAIGLADLPGWQRPHARRALFDPPTARVLKIEDPDAGFFGTMERLHGSFFIPGLGRKIIGWLGWVMTVSCLTGLWLWWPRGGFLRGLRWRRTPSTNANLHHLIGFWILVPLTVVSMTGVYMSFPKSGGSLVKLVAPTPRAPAASAAGASPATPVGVDQALAAAERLEPDLAVVSISPPGDPLGSYTIKFRTPKSTVPLAVEVNASGVANQPKPGEQDPGDLIHRLVARVHVGRGMGLLWRSLVFLAGVAPSVLGVTGTLIWLRRRRRRLALKA